MSSGCVFFWSDKARQGGRRWNMFSNWYPAPFCDPTSGRRYAHTEQYMMAQKALLFGDEAIHKAIMATSDPRKIKALGRKVGCFDPAVWEKHCFDIVLDGNRLKFTQNEELKKVLLSTGTRIIAEASPSDSVWGIGLTEVQALKCPPNQWPGRNLLGKVLMALRAELLKPHGGPAPALPTSRPLPSSSSEDAVGRPAHSPPNTDVAAKGAPPQQSSDSSAAPGVRNVKLFYSKSAKLDDLGLGLPNWRQVLSNFFPSVLEIKGKRYPTVEHFFHAEKYRLASTKPELAEMFVCGGRATNDPLRAKNFGGRAKFAEFGATFKPDVWNSVRDEVMRIALAARAQQDEQFARILEATAEQGVHLVHFERIGAASYWGGTQDSTGAVVGGNRLGHMLMDLRLRLDEDSSPKKKKRTTDGASAPAAPPSD